MSIIVLDWEGDLLIIEKDGKIIRLTAEEAEMLANMLLAEVGDG